VSATRLLVLGVVRIFQPAHGYLVRRELLSWDVENWAAINPGSIYNMLRTLTRDGLLAEVDTADVGKGPARVGYRLTPDGETSRSSSPPTTWKRPTCSATGSWSSTTARSSRSARRTGSSAGCPATRYRCG
jgi:Transcriptional regulator PadR-like family